MKQNPQFCMPSTYTYSDWEFHQKFPFFYIFFQCIQLISK